MRKRLMIMMFVLALATTYAVSQQSTAAQSSVTDTVMQRQIQSKLAANPAFKNVKATVKNGVADLSGVVPIDSDMKRAQEVASSVPGVKRVNEHLSIGEAAAASSAGTATPNTAQKESEQNTAGSIAGNAGAIGNTTGDVRPTNPAVKTESAAGNQAPAGQSIQDSQTHGESQGTQSEGMQSPSTRATNSTAGTLGMTPDVDSNTLRGQIDSALKSEPSLQNSQLSVDVNDSQITLSGTVPSGKEKVTAARIAQSYAGNRRVSDKVTVAGKTK